MSHLIEMQSAQDLLPPFESRNVVELVSAKHGKIAHVRVYSNFAEVTRVFQIPVKVGNNQVVISGFPDVIKDQSIRADIQEERLNKALTRANTGVFALEDYLEDMKENSLSDMKAIADEYMDATTDFDDRIAKLKKEIAELDKEITNERKVLNGGEVRYDFMKVSTGVFGEAEADVQLTLHYAVDHANWYPSYDIHLNTKTKEKRVTLAYKASISQTTGESWDGVPITLDTSTPENKSFRGPKVYPWRLSVYTPPPPRPSPPPKTKKAATSFPAPVRPPLPAASLPRWSDEVTSVDSLTVPSQPVKVQRRRTVHTPLAWATLKLPGLTNITSDGQMHLVNVMELEMDAETFWLDSSIRTEYHPVSEKTSNSKFLFFPVKAKVTKHTFTQTISVLNMKPYPVSGVKISDHVPVSDDSSISVTLLSPSLPVPGKNEADLDKTVSVSSGVVASGMQLVRGMDGILLRRVGVEERMEC
ncbi:hypothetical protein BDQ17DRAFT_1434729 [Cyathus striatus]|nr:hypothetical protein BDQ17DRAFT_1434729 [Cyathus striatus]